MFLRQYLTDYKYHGDYSFRSYLPKIKVFFLKTSSEGSNNLIKLRFYSINKINSTFESMNVDSAQQREQSNSRESYNSYDESNEESYEKYGKRSLPEGYTPYKENGQVVEAVYDRYDTDYEGAETPDQEANLRLKKSCCEKGGLLNLKNSIGHLTDPEGSEFPTEFFFIDKKALLKDSHWPKVTNIVRL